MPENLVLIQKNIAALLAEIPPHVTLVAACKTRSVAEVEAAYAAGLRHFGHNYVQEAQTMLPQLGFQADWHLIGHLQRNKAAEAVQIFQMVETMDSLHLAQELEKRCGQQDKILPVLIEINSGYEESKSGTLPEEVDDLVQGICELPHLRVEGLMTMGPRSGNAQEARPYFQTTRQIFERLSTLKIPNLNLHILSMGMSDSYRVAIDEGATMIRLGNVIFGKR